MPNTIDNNNVLLQLLPPDAKVILEVGCGTGSKGEQYKRIAPHSQYIGIERNPERAKLAAEKIDRVIVGDAVEILSAKASSGDASSGIAEKSVDCILYNGILSLANSDEMLARSLDLLRENGQVIARIPNAQHWHRIVKLLRGNWEEPQHCYALDEIKPLFARAGLLVYEIQTLGSQTEASLEFQKMMAPIVQGLAIAPKTFAAKTVTREYIVRALKAEKPPRRLLIQTLLAAPIGCDTVRVYEPDRFSATIPGVRTFSQVKAANPNAALPGEEKVFIWQRSIMKYPNSLPQLKELLQRGYLIVAEIDDDPLRRPDYERNRFLSYRGCHCVQTSTEPLAAYLRQHNPNVAVFANQLAYLPPPRSGDRDSVTLFFGALNRERDWQPIMPGLNRVLSRVLAKNSELVRVRVIHDRKFFDALEIEAKEFEPFCPPERYREILYACDIALLPLIPNRVNSMKSDLKFLECAASGAAVLASLTAYEDSIADGETGLIYREIDDFEAKLTELIENRELRRALAANAYQWVAENRLLSQHYRQRRDWYLQMLDELPRLNEELRDRLPELFAP